MDELDEVALKRSQRQKRSDISDEYVVYLQESKFHLRIDADLVSISQAIKKLILPSG